MTIPPIIALILGAAALFTASGCSNKFKPITLTVKENDYTIVMLGSGISIKISHSKKSESYGEQFSDQALISINVASDPFNNVNLGKGSATLKKGDYISFTVKGKSHRLVLKDYNKDTGIAALNIVQEQPIKAR